MKKNFAASAIRMTILTIALIVALFPLYWMINTALKPNGEIFQLPPSFVSEHWSFSAFVSLVSTRPIVTYFINSLIVATGTTALCISLASLAAYGLTRFSIRIEPLILMGLLFIKMLPETLLVVPFYALIADFRLLNSYVSLILVYSSFALPFAVWMLIGFFRVIPKELDEAAIVDGASRLQAFASIIIPLARPGLAAVSMLTFLTAWNSYLWALVLTTTPDMFVLPVGIAALKGEYQIQWNELMAAAVIAVVPVLAIYSVFERHLVAGITAGAIKG